MTETLADYLASQDELVQEASEALPHQFSQCTYSLGPVRQAIYLCLTCPEARGICGACSIACHHDHEQIELFPKRNFRCDCPTDAIAHPCVLHTKLEPVNALNQYGQNFQGHFCRCKRTYDANTEKETMIQCLTCEDWFHESCCNLRERPCSRESSPEIKDQLKPSADGFNGDIDAVSDTSSGLPPPLIGPSDYDCFVCSSCVSKIPILQKWAGTPGTLMVVRDTPAVPWKVLPSEGSNQTVDIDIVDTSELPSGVKRPLSPTAHQETETKRARLSSSSGASASCLVPTPNPVAQKIFSAINTGVYDPETSLGAGDIFLTEGFRSRWCRCFSCLPFLETNRCLLEEEETYEPPDDPDSGLSLEELGMRALSRLPRANVIDSIQAFNSMRDDLVNYLRPFAEEGKVVNEADVREFFDSLIEAKKETRS